MCGADGDHHSSMVAHPMWYSKLLVMVSITLSSYGLYTILCAVM